MRFKILFLVLILCSFFFHFVPTAHGFELGGVQFKNKVYLLHVENDTGEFSHQFEHILNVSKKGSPLRSLRQMRF